MKKKSILVLTNMGPNHNNPSLGSFVLNQVKALKQSQKLDVQIYKMPKSAYFFKASIIRYSLWFVGFIWHLLLHPKRVEIVHVHFFYPTILLAALYKKFINPTVKIIATFHGSDIYLYTPFTKRYEDMMAILDTAIYVSSDLAARHQMFGLEKMVIPAGIKNEFQAFTETEKKYDFIFIGNLELIKGADRLLSMIDKMPKRQFLVVGNGEYSDKLKRANYEHVEYLAHATPSTLCKLINQSYCLINLSRSESFGLVMTEALACHTPVIATQTDGSKEQLADLQCAQIIPQEYTHELIESEYIKLRSKKLSWDDTDKHIRKYKLEHIANQLEQLYLS